MAKIIWLALASQQQLTFKHCGPAVIRMVLSQFGVLRSQSSLWTDVQNSSAGTSPVGGALPTVEFANQVCHLCGTWRCWYTTPEAMAQTVTTYAPAGVRAIASFPITRDDAVTAQIDSLERSKRFPPATTILGSNHWVVVNGFHMDDPLYPGAPLVAIGNRLVNGIYHMDPFQNPTPVVRFISSAAWKRILKSIDCGTNVNAYPTVVGADGVSFIFKWWLFIVLWVKRWPPPWPWSGRPEAIGPM